MEEAMSGAVPAQPEPKLDEQGRVLLGHIACAEGMKSWLKHTGTWQDGKVPVYAKPHKKKTPEELAAAEKERKDKRAALVKKNEAARDKHRREKKHALEDVAELQKKLRKTENLGNLEIAEKLNTAKAALEEVKAKTWKDYL